MIDFGQVTQQGQTQLGYRYLSNDNTYDTLYEPWSSSKIFAYTGALAKARQQGMSAHAMAGAHRISDLITSINTYEPSANADGNSNAIATYFANVAGRDFLTSLFHDRWLLLHNPLIRFRGAYGPTAFEPSAPTWLNLTTQAVVNINSFSQATDDPGYQGYRCKTCGLNGNKPMTTLAQAEWLKRLAVHGRDPLTAHPELQTIDIETLFANKLNYFQLIKDVNGDTYNSRYPENAKITTLEPGKSYIMIRTTNNLPTPDAASVSFSVPINNIDVEEEEEPDVLIEQDTQDFQFDTNVVTFPGDLANTTLFSSFIDISSYSMKYIFENFLYLDENTPITSYPENTRADVVAAYIAEVKAQDRTTTDVKRYIPASSVGSPDSIDTSKHCMVYSITYNVNSFYAPSAFTENFRRSAFLRIPGNIVNTGTISFKAGINYFALPGKNAATYTAIFGNHLDKIVYIKDIGTELSNGLISGGGYTINPELDFNSIGFLIPKKVYIVKTNQDFFINI